MNSPASTRQPGRDMPSQLPGAAGPDKMSSQAGQSQLFCEQCKIQQLGLRICSRCRAVSYCSKDCQISHWKIHKPVCVRPVEAPADKGAIWGIRLSSNPDLPVLDSFIPELLAVNHPIFTLGELCPATALYGIPLIICSTRMFSKDYDKTNQPAVYLRIEPHDGIAPFHWQVGYLGDCFVIRKDRKPLQKELLETMYKFHASLLYSDFFELENPGSRINSALFHTFADKYVEEQRNIGRNGFDNRFFLKNSR